MQNNLNKKLRCIERRKNMVITVVDVKEIVSKVPGLDEFKDSGLNI